MELKAGILAVGTEVSSGEIVNTNGAWIAGRLEDLGFTVDLHAVVPDQHDLIARGLDWLSQSCRLIVVVGGLGPTSDDFTRVVISNWAGKPLEFNNQTWDELNRLYEARGARIREAHRQQCEFPKDAEQLHNPVGSAHGFVLDCKNVKLVVLPGPPREIEGMWPVSVVPMLEKLAPERTIDLKVWKLTGISESGAAEITEEVLKGSGYKIGYRASPPFVRVKVWIPRKDPQSQKWVENLSNSLKKWVVS